MEIRYLVSKDPNRKSLSGSPDQRMYKTKSAAQERVKKVKKITGKKYYISKIDL